MPPPRPTQQNVRTNSIECFRRNNFVTKHGEKVLSVRMENNFYRYMDNKNYEILQ